MKAIFKVLVSRSTVSVVAAGMENVGDPALIPPARQSREEALAMLKRLLGDRWQTSSLEQAYGEAQHD